MIKARVQMMVEVDLSGTWDDTCTAAQLFDQAKDEALGSLGNLFEALHRGEVVYGSCKHRLAARFVGEPRVTAVITEGR